MNLLQPKYRFEVLLPLFYNDGSPVEGEKVDAALAEVLGRFTAYRYQPTAPFHGEWTDLQTAPQPTVYRDQLILLIVDTERTDECVEWFHAYKSRLAETFQQVEIYIAVTEIYWL